jgi:hypothetical protein
MMLDALSCMARTIANPPPINPSAGDHATASSAAPSAQYRCQPSTNTQPTRPWTTGPRVQLIRDVSPFNAYAEVIDICRCYRRPPIDSDNSNLHGQQTPPPLTITQQRQYEQGGESICKLIIAFWGWEMIFLASNFVLPDNFTTYLMCKE